MRRIVKGEFTIRRLDVQGDAGRANECFIRQLAVQSSQDVVDAPLYLQLVPDGSSNTLV